MKKITCPKPNSGRAKILDLNIEFKLILLLCSLHLLFIYPSIYFLSLLIFPFVLLTMFFLFLCIPVYLCLFFCVLFLSDFTSVLEGFYLPLSLTPFLSFHFLSLSLFSSLYWYNCLSVHHSFICVCICLYFSIHPSVHPCMLFISPNPYLNLSYTFEFSLWVSVSVSLFFPFSIYSFTPHFSPPLFSLFVQSCCSSRYFRQVLTCYFIQGQEIRHHVLKIYALLWQ